MEQYKLFINNEFVDAQNNSSFEVIDPGTGLPMAEVQKAGTQDTEDAIQAARQAFDRGIWSDLTPDQRLEKMLAFADQIAQQGLRLAMTESMNAGHIMGLAKVEPLLGVGFTRNMSNYMAKKFTWTEQITCSGNVFAPGRETIRREPLGVCAGIIPWNFPMTMAFWKIIPAIAMGNTVVLKPASATPLTALIIGEAAKAAGIPAGVINIIPGAGSEVGEILCTHKDIDKVAFTGSTEVGRKVMQLASETIKKVTLELGGKSANIILDDADMDLAVEGAVFGTFFHQGQVCESGTRVLVPSSIYDEFLAKMKQRAESIRIGYQLDANSHMGPLVSAQQMATVEKYVAIGREEGARIVTGGERLTLEGLEGGFYYPPTIFADVKNEMRIAQEEIFGPVVSVIKYDSDEEAIAIANDSIYGLAGGIFTSNPKRAENIVQKVKTGSMWINNYHVFADMSPFGGYKQSGVGREMGAEGLAEYTQVKRIHMPTHSDKQTNMNFALMSDNKKMNGFAYIAPTRLIAGKGSLSSLHKVITDLQCSRALLLTDKGVNQAGLAKMVENNLIECCVGLYDEIPSDPDLAAIDKAVEYARSVQADCIVSVGGGSVIDSAKAMCVTLTNGGKANDHLNLLMLEGPQMPHICIPTTSGTGSEVTNVAVITSDGAGRKLFIADPWITPNAAILDPKMTVSLPKAMTVTTAMDAMTHAVEAMTSIMSNPICDGHAVQAIKLINLNLPVVMTDPDNEEARLNLQIAATMAGWAFTIAQVGLAHGMAHSLGTLHHLPHGAACGIVLPKVMRYNVDFAAGKLAQVAQAMGVDTSKMDEKEAALAAADSVENLMKETGHPIKLSDEGVTEDDLLMCAFHAIADTATMFNARPVNDPNEVLDVFKQAL